MFSTRYNQHKDVLGALILSSKDPYRCVIYSETSNGTTHAKQFCFPFKLVEVCNYCDGLICFKTSGYDIFLWNTSLRVAYKTIPIEYNTNRPSELDRFCVGIGYDSSTDDYKIVRVPKHMYENIRNSSFVDVFSQKSNSWNKREISKNFTCELQQKKNIYTRNRLHWIGRRDGATGLIVYVVSLPCASQQTLNYNDALAIIDNFILWVRVDYNGMESSWNKFQLLKLKYLDYISNFCFRYCCFTRDGKILIHLRKRGLRTCDPTKGYLEKVVIRGDDNMFQEASLEWFSPRWF
ncbi:F-box and associated interaction domains-containing protein [Euphorbia peplus]|nr:F-box and associated interaction domains-containing protein [Euphorbia peplus]